MSRRKSAKKAVKRAKVTKQQREKQQGKVASKPRGGVWLSVIEPFVG